MEIELIARPLFDLKVGETVFKDFSLTSEWEGFKKLNSVRHGTVILAVKEPSNDLFKLFEFLDPKKSEHQPTKKVVIVRASPDILAALSNNDAKVGAE